MFVCRSIYSTVKNDACKVVKLLTLACYMCVHIVTMATYFVIDKSVFHVAHC